MCARVVCLFREGAEAMTFTTALHTYFRVVDATTARVEGLKVGLYKLNAVDP
jgi:D-hexose-6-phosphate mutarotase